MLLVVVGLLVLVLVILVVVFLSVRSMRDAEEDGYEDRSAPRRPARGSRDDDTVLASTGARPRGTSRDRQSRAARRGPARESWPNDREAAHSRSAAEYDDDAGPSQRRAPALPRPRGYQHDQDRPPETSRRAARSQPRQAAARLTGGDRSQAGKDWSDTDWGGVSDEQYWAELSSDKPLATTARSAQPASAGRAAATAMAATLSAPERNPAAGGTGPVKFGDRPEPTADGTAADSWGPAEPRTFGDPSSMPGHSRLADRPAATESNATDPGLGSQAGWPGSVDDTASTAAWTVAGAGSTHDWAAQEPRDESWGEPGQSTASGPGWHAPDESATAAWTAQDAAMASGVNWADEPSAADWGGPDQSSPAWNGDHATPAWNDDQPAAGSWNSPVDPLTSPSFPAGDGYAAVGGAFDDSRSYRRSHDRARAQYDSSPDVLGGVQPGYAGSHSNGDSYSTSWPGSSDDYSHGSHSQLEPLPEPGGSPAAAQSWHSAPVSAGDSGFYAEPAAQPWDQAGTEYDNAPRHRSHRQSQDDGYSSQPDYREWPVPEAGHQQSAGYQPSHGQGHSDGYGQGYRDYEPGYGADRGDGGYGSNGNGYSLPTRGSGPAVNGYGHGQRSGYDDDRWQ